MIIDALEYLKQPPARQCGKSGMRLKLMWACYEALCKGQRYLEYETVFVENESGWLSPDVKIKEMRND